jgi:hypothetical protein
MTATPLWYIGACMANFSGAWSPVLVGVPLAGAVALVLGVIWGVCIGRSGLFGFVAPVLMSETFVTAAGFFRGRLRGDACSAVTGAFLVAVLIVCVALIVRLKGARVPAVLLTLFSIVYSLFAGFVATMAFKGAWH